MITPKNLLIIRTDRIGDLVLTAPLAEIVKKHYPECKVTFLIRDYTKDVLYNHPFIDELIFIKIKNKKNKIFFWANQKLISEKNFDTVIVVSPNPRIAVITFLSKIKNRIGTGFRWYSFLFNKKIFVHRKFADKHELEFNIELLKEIGIVEKVNKENVNYSLQINIDAQKKIDEILKNENINLTKPLYIIHPGSGGSSINLPIGKYKELIEKISSVLDVEIIITGNNNEKVICDELIINEKVHNLAGRFSLSELMALINKCDLFISNSTGPLHIASAFNKNVIGFYPNLLACSSKRWGPYSLKSKVFTPPLNCKDCKMERCLNERCMNNIDMNDVADYIKRLKINFS